MLSSKLPVRTVYCGPASKRSAQPASACRVSCSGSIDTETTTTTTTTNGLGISAVQH